MEVEINLGEGWVKRLRVDNDYQKYDVFVEEKSSYLTEIWADVGKKDLIAKVPGVSYVGVSEDMPTCYDVTFDARYNKNRVIEEILIMLAKDMQDEN